MRTIADGDELDLPPLDGESDGDEATSDPDSHEELEAPDDGSDALDDATADADPLEEIAVDGAEGGWLGDADDGAEALDLGALDLALSEEGRLLEDDAPDGRPMDDLLPTAEEDAVVDGGEEGPLAEDEELREEDLPALDADDDGDVDADGLYDHAVIADEDELRWDDRAWERVGDLSNLARDDADDSGLLVAPGDDERHSARDAAWRKLEESGRVTAAAFVPGESVIVAVDGAERPLLVRILPDGTARIVAEVDAPEGEDGAACRVTGLRWDMARGCVVVSGTFGALAFRPA